MKKLHLLLITLCFFAFVSLNSCQQKSAETEGTEETTPMEDETAPMEEDTTIDTTVVE
jgi:hypothetical protein